MPGFCSTDADSVDRPPTIPRGIGDLAPGAGSHPSPGARAAWEDPDLYRSRGSHVCLGGLHVTTNPGEALPHADTIFLGPSEDTWPAFLKDLQERRPSSIYRSRRRSLAELPMPRRDLIHRGRYLVPNSLVVSRGCPHHCAFCYKDTFYAGGKSFYTLETDRALKDVSKTQNLGRDYGEAIRRLHGLGVMINASFVYSMDDDGPDVFDRTVDWALSQGLETATFHILTPYPGTALRAGLEAEGRLLTEDWDRYDTRHVVFRPARMSSEELEAGYWRSYERFYSWKGILQAAGTKPDLRSQLRHGLCTAGWKKLEPLWNLAIRSGALAWARPLLEGLLDGKAPRTRSVANPMTPRGSWT